MICLLPFYLACRCIPTVMFQLLPEFVCVFVTEIVIVCFTPRFLHPRVSFTVFFIFFFFLLPAQSQFWVLLAGIRHSLHSPIWFFPDHSPMPRYLNSIPDLSFKAPWKFFTSSSSRHPIHNPYHQVIPHPLSIPSIHPHPIPSHNLPQPYYRYHRHHTHPELLLHLPLYIDN